MQTVSYDLYNSLNFLIEKAQVEQSIEQGSGTFLAERAMKVS